MSQSSERITDTKTPVAGVGDELALEYLVGTMERAMACRRGGCEVFYIPPGGHGSGAELLAKLKAHLAQPAPVGEDETVVRNIQEQLCRVLGVDPQSVALDGATGNLTDDVQSAICKVLIAWAGDDWWSIPTAPSSLRHSPPAESAGLRGALGEPFMTAHSDSDSFYVRLKYQTLAEMQAAHTALCDFFQGKPRAVSGEFSFPQPHRSQMWEVLRCLGEKAIRSQKITDHAAASAAQHEALQEIERLVSRSLAPQRPKAETQAGVGEELTWLQTQVILLCEHTEDKSHAELQKPDLTEHERGFHKGAYTEARGIRRAIADIVRTRLAALAPAPAADGGRA